MCQSISNRQLIQMQASDDKNAAEMIGGLTCL